MMQYTACQDRNSRATLVGPAFLVEDPFVDELQAAAVDGCLLLEDPVCDLLVHEPVLEPDEVVEVELPGEDEVECREMRELQPPGELPGG